MGLARGEVGGGQLAGADLGGDGEGAGKIGGANGVTVTEAAVERGHLAVAEDVASEDAADGVREPDLLVRDVCGEGDVVEDELTGVLKRECGHAKTQSNLIV
jgi:hypothetical protein